MSRWYVIEGDDHESRIAEAQTEREAIGNVHTDFKSQYGRYSRNLLSFVGDYESEDAAQAAHPNAESV